MEKFRIAVVDRDRCKPQKCSRECEKYCPVVRSGAEAVVIEDKAVISEELCVGCGICVKKCPFKAISIVGLPHELEGKEVHRYGKNGFVLYNLPIPRKGHVVGLLGPNGTGKTTAVKILSGQIKPNLGKDEADWEEIFERFAGTELLDYLKSLVDGIRTSVKPQYIEAIPRVYKGKAKDLLSKADEIGKIDEMVEKLSLKNSIERDVRHLSGGELQRLAIAACLLRDADFYFLDEVTSYLDIYQRISVAKVIREKAEEKPVLIVEHDLAILDMLADYVHLSYGTPAVYGVITNAKGVRVGINQYLRGYLPDENIRIRDKPIEFEVFQPREGELERTVLEYPPFRKTLNGFTLEAAGGEIKQSEVLGIVGPNATGKSTFVKILAGVLEDDEGKIERDEELKTSYKPQYIKTESDMTVASFLTKINPMVNTSYYKTEFLKPLRIEELMDRNLKDLSGGELQRVAIVACLLRDADLYLLDEPSAHLDVEQRTETARIIRRFALNTKKSIFVVDHDIYLIDMISDRLIVFEGEPGKKGISSSPLSMRDGMNRFLSNLEITFRRDEETKRPRVNKIDSRLDREQKSKGEFYYYF
ncbi:putative ATPase, RNase L inhibitor (RLI)-like protein [Archaeoglobus sulfaticallidus PM70-1]|uniref:Putative ATPase, RNase L inhibitor (RLI)-like protein n=1 Tax=Archaeoglobus sulfaticallidus PM70-1 TaxID=387631 RepID=N0BL40_9EURY|nr:ribosome biogenesis/translation initiation ATPase RLI [Archaeoglobus sulfaticallidus]AGK60925.1 putative ATPase, RNase L inhibitor (RLI)-like protein [Archaeoglobus sulfaticallidus PM70-1]